MKLISYTSVLIVLLIAQGCIQEFIPSTVESKFNLVVDGLITNQPEVYTVKLSCSIPFGIWTTVPLEGCDVTVQDDLGNIYQFTETSTRGTYISDESTFRGEIGRKYTLHINTNYATPHHYSYESLPVEMKAVPPIDSLYYEKIIIKEWTPNTDAWEGCGIYLNTYDPDGNCRYYRWDYTETWKFEIPYSYVENRVCWDSGYSWNDINIRNTMGLSEDRINHQPMTFISNNTDRLSTRYRILVNQYSLSEDEYMYWQKIKDVSQDIGGLWDIMPYSITGNIFCIDDPGEQVFGYFSASATTSRQLYIEEKFSGLVNLWEECPDDTLFNTQENPLPPKINGKYQIDGLDISKWILIEKRNEETNTVEYLVLTFEKWCSDCTSRGTLTKPDFWEDF